EDAAVERAIDRRLLPRGAARLERPPRRVEPDVDALHEHAADAHVVVLEEEHTAAERRLLAELEDVLDELLPRAVRRVRLAGEQDLHRPLLVEEQVAQLVRVGEDEAGPLVGGEAAREADGERVVAEEGLDLAQLLRRAAVTGELLA